MNTMPSLVNPTSASLQGTAHTAGHCVSSIRPEGRRPVAEDLGAGPHPTGSLASRGPPKTPRLSSQASLSCREADPPRLLPGVPVTPCRFRQDCSLQDAVSISAPHFGAP